jgi:hypothetical protein
MAEAAQAEPGLTFEKVWEMFQEIGRKQEETDREMKATDRQMKETDRRLRETEQLVARVTANVGGLNRSMGELIETLIGARLWEKFDGYPYNLKQAYQRMPVYDETGRRRSEIDILLADGEYVMAVEVKASLHRKDDVDDHLRRMELILKYPPAQCKGKKLLGAMAGGVVDPEIQEYAHGAGFFVLELAGESVRLVQAPEGFAPRQW